MSGTIRHWYDFGLFDVTRALERPVMMYDQLDWDRDYSYNLDNRRLREKVIADARPLLKSGHFGVSYDRWSGKWVANIRINGRRVRLGKFPTEEIAAAIYTKAAKQKIS